MDLKNKLGLDGLEFRHEEERISKQKVKRLYDKDIKEEGSWKIDLEEGDLLKLTAEVTLTISTSIVLE